MLFDSFAFIFFLPIVFILYWFVFNKSNRLQNTLLLVASYYFYACWDWRFLFLLAFSTLINYYAGLKISSSDKHSQKKAHLYVVVSLNLLLLAFFKYCNFFIESFNDLLMSIGLNTHISSLQIILPVGISFYTFHGLSYILDIYKGKIKPTKNIIDYSLFVSFFTLLVAGPIERAGHLLPQIKTPRTFNYLQATSGMKQILWGFFKKMVIADNCGNYANIIFNNSDTHSSSTLLLGAVLFTFQIYGDFSGYSDIALGASRLLGFELLKNFNFPYFSRNIAEFWRRWHISLSSWFRDYLYIPLGGSRGGTWMRIRNTFIIFLVSGFWHGANWTFIAWGGLNALMIMPSIVMRSNRTSLDTVAEGKLTPTFKEALQVLSTFILTVFAWIFFRANDMSHAFRYIGGIFNKSILSRPEVTGSGSVLLLVAFLMLVEWCGRERNFALENFGSRWHIAFRWAFYLLVLLLIFIFQVAEKQPFIYFQF